LAPFGNFRDSVSVCLSRYLKYFVFVLILLSGSKFIALRYSLAVSTTFGAP